jgi:hypothetical protein
MEARELRSANLVMLRIEDGDPRVKTLAMAEAIARKERELPPHARKERLELARHRMRLVNCGRRLHGAELVLAARESACRVPAGAAARYAECRGSLCARWQVRRFSVGLSSALRRMFQGVDATRLAEVVLTPPCNVPAGEGLRRWRADFMGRWRLLGSRASWRRSFACWMGALHLKWKPRDGWWIHLHLVVKLASSDIDFHPILQAWCGLWQVPPRGTMLHPDSVRDLAKTATYIFHVDNLVPDIADMPALELLAFLGAMKGTRRAVRGHA